MVMFIGDVRLLSRYYVFGGRKITVRTAYRRKSSKSLPHPELIKSIPDVVLYFDEKGIIKECLDKHKGQRIIFNYNGNNRLSELLIYGKSRNYFIESTRFEYDDHGRILSEVVYEQNCDDDDNLPQILYEYEANSVITTLLPDKYSKDIGIFIYTYNDLDQLIEQKGIINEKELIMWNRFRVQFKWPKGQGYFS